MQLEHMINEYIDNILSNIWETDEIGIFGETINNKKEHNFTLRFGQAFNEVHSNMSPCHARNRQWLKKTRVRDVL